MFRGTLLTRKGEPYTVRLMKAADVRIVRHTLIRHEANPYDPAWEGYFEERLYSKMQSTLAGRGKIYWLWREQQGRCPGCNQPLREEEDWHIHHRIRRRRWLG